MENEFVCLADLNLYSYSEKKRELELETQALKGRHIQVVSDTPTRFSGLGDQEFFLFPVRLLEDGYKAWLKRCDYEHLKRTQDNYMTTNFTQKEIEKAIPDIIKFILDAMNIFGGVQ